MKLYTKYGDGGQTALFGGQRVPKNHVRVAAYGEVDELNAAIGVAVAAAMPPTLAERLQRIQADLFSLGAELATPDGESSATGIREDGVSLLESWIDEATEVVAPLRNFVLPGGSSAAAALHMARTVCRRAERAVVTLAEKEKVRPLVLVYLNRLSDLLFAFARLANHEAGVPDVPWKASSQ